MLYNAALVLEGGAFRGQYTAGIIDTFLAHHIEFRSVIGVSAGSLNGVNFVSKQYGRAANININHRHDRHYISMTRVFRKEIINLDYLFEDHGYSWENFNERAYKRSASHFTAVATALRTGKAVLFTDPTGDQLTQALKASSSMPFLSNPQETSQGPCLDGGIADSIPYDVAQQQGYDKIVIVRTRDTKYRKIRPVEPFVNSTTGFTRTTHSLPKRGLTVPWSITVRLPQSTNWLMKVAFIILLPSHQSKSNG